MIKLLIDPSPQYIRDNILWRVYLNDGTIIYQNDIEGERSSWLQLKEYLENNKNKYIEHMHLMFRDHIETIGSYGSFFFFSHKVLANQGSELIKYFYLGGFSNNAETLHVKHFVMPELLLDEEDDRSIMSMTCRRGLIAHPDYIDMFKDNYYDERK